LSLKEKAHGPSLGQTVFEDGSSVVGFMLDKIRIGKAHTQKNNIKNIKDWN